MRKKEGKIRVLVTGCQGQLGSEIISLGQKYSDFSFTTIDISDLDLTDEAAVKSYFSMREFDVIVNCSAYTAVDLAEDNSEMAFKVNSDSVRILAEVCRSKNIRFIHISTDYVFDGNATAPITEETKTSPLSVYGKSKLEGEINLLSILPDAYVIRTAWLYSSFGKNFVKTMIRLASEREEVSVVCDQFGSPTYAADLADAILSIIDSIFNKNIDYPGVYHYSNEGSISWCDFASAVVRHCNLPAKVKPITSDQYVTRAIRPKYSVLDKNKIRQNFGIYVPKWQDSLKRCLEKMPEAQRYVAAKLAS